MVVQVNFDVNEADVNEPPKCESKGWLREYRGYPFVIMVAIL